MGSRRQGVREGIPNVNYEREQETFMATMNDVAEVVREAAVGAARAVERLGVRNGNDENNLGHPERPMTLATFLKVNPPKFKSTLVATDADNWFRGNPADFKEWKCLKFEGGLREDLISSVVPLEIRNFAELVNKCKLVGECAKKVTASKASRQGFPPRNYNSYSWQPRRTNFKSPGVPQRRNPQAGNAPARPTSGNGGRLRQDNGKRPQQAQVNTTCRQCGKDHGHMVKNCPKRFTQNPARTQQQGRVFAMTADDAMQSDALIQGQCIVKDRFLTVLYDSGASHSFVSLTIARELGLDFSELNFDLIVHTPASQNVLTSLVCLQYHVFLDCFERTAVIPSGSLDIKPFLSYTLYLNSVRVTLNGSDCEGYVLLAASSNDSEVSLEQIRVVKEFPDVFPIQMVKEFPDVFLDDIPEFLPQQEIKFSIDLVPGSEPIFIAPYRMSPLLAELKKL
ncbi:uncharacterized protein LOC107462990 [Arachis duranensis]|uniref:Uncharacterized protein LOC107462990 n=1 Tax=Arachis duranensis TaxID=130453 RepID=A0A9C6T8V2_ARADU|nr:uncharacterized protein LOC107462990 [Arachis duranensis]